MNAKQRDSIDKINRELQVTLGRLQDIQSECQEAYDNMPESLQQSVNGDNAQEAIDMLESACRNLESTIDEISSIA